MTEEKTYSQAELDTILKKEVSGLKNKNDELLASLANLKGEFKKFDGLNIEGLKKLADNAKTEEEKRMLEGGQFEQLLQTKISEAVTPLQTQLESTKEQLGKVVDERDSLSKNNERILGENFLRSKASKVKDLHPSAIDDVVNRGLGVFKPSDGGYSAFDGDKPLFKENKPLGAVDWIEGLRDSHPHYFNSAVGGGARGGSGGDVDISSYFDPKSPNYNETKQAEIAKKDQAQYETYSNKFS